MGAGVFPVLINSQYESKKMNSERERIIVSKGTDAGADPATGGRVRSRRRPRQRLTALGWLMVFWCGLPVVFSRTILTQAVTGFSFGSALTITPSRWWVSRILSIIINTWIDIFLWALLDPDYGWIGCGFVVLTVAALLFFCLAHLFEAMGFLVYEEELV